MNTYKKFSNYLLTHQPLLWHSRAIQLTVVVLMLNLMFYFLGFLRIDLLTLKEHWNIERLFFKETYSLFWIIVGLIVLIAWGAYFYRNNAAKNFYPISKWYFHKMALFLFIPALLYFMVPFSFFRGAAHKTQIIIPVSDFNELQKQYAHAYPFLIHDTRDFDFTNRSYPEVYQNVRYWSTSDYQDQYYHISGHPEKISKLLDGVDAEPIVSSTYAFRSESKESMEIIDRDTCWNLKDFFLYAYTLDSFPDFATRHVKNYTPSKLYSNYTSYYKSNEYSSYVEHEQDLIATLHHWMDHEPERILETLEKFHALVTTYKIYNTLDPKKNYSYLIENNFTVYQQITRSVAYERNHYYEEESQLPSMFNSDEKGAFTQALNIAYLNHFLANAETAHNAPFFHDKNMKTIFKFLALAGVLLLIYFQWGSVLAFVISIPVAGAFAIFGTLLATFFHNPTFALFVILFLCGFFLFMAILGIRGYLKPMVGNIAITISYFVFPLWVLIILSFVQQALMRPVYRPCLDWIESVYPFEFNQDPVASILLYAPFVLFFISLFFIKRILAKKE